MGVHRTGVAWWGIAVLVVMVAGGCTTQTQAPAPVVERSRPAGDPAPTSYVVRPRDSLYAIAWRFGLDYMAVARWNGIGPPYTIHPGQTLRLRPDGALAATETRPRDPRGVEDGTTRAGTSSRYADNDIASNRDAHYVLHAQDARRPSPQAAGDGRGGAADNHAEARRPGTERRADAGTEPGGARANRRPVRRALALARGRAAGTGVRRGQQGRRLHHSRGPPGGRRRAGPGGVRGAGPCRLPPPRHRGAWWRIPVGV